LYTKYKIVIVFSTIAKQFIKWNNDFYNIYNTQTLWLKNLMFHIPKLSIVSFIKFCQTFKLLLNNNAYSKI